MGYLPPPVQSEARLKSKPRPEPAFLGAASLLRAIHHDRCLDRRNKKGLLTRWSEILWCFSLTGLLEPGEFYIGDLIGASLVGRVAFPASTSARPLKYFT